MKRFVVAAALAVALGFGFSGKASAQIVYGYSVPNAGGYVTGGTAYAPGATKSFQSYYSPFTGVYQKQVFYNDIFGQSYGRSYTYNPYTGMGFRSGFYQPNYFNPFGGYSYNTWGRRW